MADDYCKTKKEKTRRYTVRNHNNKKGENTKVKEEKMHRRNEKNNLVRGDVGSGAIRYSLLGVGAARIIYILYAVIGLCVCARPSVRPPRLRA